MTLKMIKKDEPIRTGADIANEITSYEAMHEPIIKTNVDSPVTKEYMELVGTVWVSIEWLKESLKQRIHENKDYSNWFEAQEDEWFLSLLEEKR